MGSIAGLERSPSPRLPCPPPGGKGKPLQYSCLENPMDRGAWWATVHGIAKSWTQLSMHDWATELNWTELKHARMQVPRVFHVLTTFLGAGIEWYSKAPGTQPAPANDACYYHYYGWWCHSGPKSLCFVSTSTQMLIRSSQTSRSGLQLIVRGSQLSGPTIHWGPDTNQALMGTIIPLLLPPTARQNARVLWD